MLVTRNSGNPIYTLMFNDFRLMFETFGGLYFSLHTARDVSRKYYREIKDAVGKGGDHAESVVRTCMEKTTEIRMDL